MMIASKNRSIEPLRPGWRAKAAAQGSQRGRQEPLDGGLLGASGAADLAGH
jgi:hypothetical protein